MLRNEIDDSAPPRCLVHASTVVDVLPEVKRKYFMPVVSYRIMVHDVDIALVNDLRDRGLQMILFTYEGDPVTAEEVLDSLGSYSHPFNESLVFPTPGALSHYLAMQGDVRYVIDRRFPLAFGTRSLAI